MADTVILSQFYHPDFQNALLVLSVLTLSICQANSSLEVLSLLLCTLLLRSLPRSPHHTQPLYCALEQYLYTILRGREHLSSPYSHECIYLLYSLSKAQTWNFKSCWLMSSH